MLLTTGEGFAGGVLDLCLYVTSSVPPEEDSDSNDDRLCRARRNFFFNSSISLCMSFSFFAWDTWLFPRNWILLVCMVCPFFSRSPLYWGFTSDWLCCKPPDSAWCRLSLPWCGPIVGWCEPDFSILCTKPKSLSDQIKQFPTDGANCKDQLWLEPRTGIEPGLKSPNNKFVESGRIS